MGFFQESELLVSQEPMRQTPACGQCGLLRTCKSPKMPVTGKGNKKILIIGEAPGGDEDDRNKQFVGRTGQLLESTLARYGVDMRADCWLTNALSCRPPGNAEPTSTQIESCRPLVIRAIEELKPHKILLFGGPAVSSVIGWLWKEKPQGIGRWIGWQIPAQKINAWVCPFWHPSYIARQDDRDPLAKTVEIIWRRTIKQALALTGRPWDSVPDFKSQVKVVIDHREAGSLIREFTKRGYPTAFDFETNCLKPDWDDAEIVSCSLADSESTISFPWVGDVIPAMREFVRSKSKKIASNLKFEDRWCRRKLMTGVRNWFWDTMIAGHCIDNRRQIASIKFQSFVLLGAESYNDHIAPFLRTKGGEKINSVLKSVELRQLLLYGGLDSLLEYHVCLKQRKIMGC